MQYTQIAQTGAAATVAGRCIFCNTQQRTMPRPPPRSLQEYFYYLLLDSPGFNRWVRRIHARVNRIPYLAEREPSQTVDAQLYTPTRFQRMNAFRIIWVDEIKRTFKIW